MILSSWKNKQTKPSFEVVVGYCGGCLHSCPHTQCTSIPVKYLQSISDII